MTTQPAARTAALDNAAAETALVDAGTRYGISITVRPPTCPGHRPGLGAFLGELPGHPFKDTFGGDSEFVPLGPCA